MNHRSYGLAGSLSAKVKGFMGLPRGLNVVMRAQLQDVQRQRLKSISTNS